MEKFRSLLAWQKAHKLVLVIYQLTKRFPGDEKFILVPQLIRAAVSIAANLAEGTKRKTKNDQKHFFNMAETSLEEVKYYLILAHDLNYIAEQEFQDAFDLTQETGRLISGLLRS